MMPVRDYVVRLTVTVVIAAEHEDSAIATAENAIKRGLANAAEAVAITGREAMLIPRPLPTVPPRRLHDEPHAEITSADRASLRATGHAGWQR